MPSAPQLNSAVGPAKCSASTASTAGPAKKCGASSATTAAPAQPGASAASTAAPAQPDASVASTAAPAQPDASAASTAAPAQPGASAASTAALAQPDASAASTTAAPAKCGALASLTSIPSADLVRYEVKVRQALQSLKSEGTPYISNTASMMVVMTEDQKRMLGRYGRITCIDATYRVVQWGLPFFMLVVVDEHNQCFPAAYFMVAEESDVSIAEAFLHIKHMVAEWNPKVFIMDKCDAEMNAVKKIFPEAIIILCEFHAKQAWLRWLKTSANGVPKGEVNLIYKALCDVMMASSTEVAKAMVMCTSKPTMKPHN